MVYYEYHSLYGRRFQYAEHVTMHVVPTFLQYSNSETFASELLEKEDFL